MTCDVKLKKNQTISERAAEVRAATERLAVAIATGRVKVVVDKATGAVAFTGWEGNNRDGVSDACAYRRLMATGSAMSKMLIARAEQLAGRQVDKKAVAQGLHSHDNGLTFHKH